MEFSYPTILRRYISTLIDCNPIPNDLAKHELWQSLLSQFRIQSEFPSLL